MKNMQIYIICAFVSLMFPLEANAAPSLEKAQAFINKLGEDTIRMIKDGALSSKAKEQKLDDLFMTTVNTAWMSKFVLGRYYRSMNEEQRRDFATTYGSFLRVTYVPNFRRYTGEAFHVIGGKSLSNNEFVISTKITSQEDGASYQVDYRLRCDGEERFRIYDIIAEGISLITTQRSEFASVISNNGVDYLIERLKSKIDKASSTS